MLTAIDHNANILHGLSLTNKFQLTAKYTTAELQRWANNEMCLWSKLDAKKY